LWRRPRPKLGCGAKERRRIKRNGGGGDKNNNNNITGLTFRIIRIV
jgi:hypothetical protein